MITLVVCVTGATALLWLKGNKVKKVGAPIECTKLLNKT
jgi:hypothetical protein